MRSMRASELNTDSDFDRGDANRAAGQTMDEQINTLREWAEGRARNASVPRDFQTDTFRRNIDANEPQLRQEPANHD